MKMKKKGKVYPSPSSSAAASSQYLEDDSLSILRLLPATILVLVSILSAEDREVLAYLITRGTTSYADSKNKTTKKKTNKSSKTHKPPVFDCECFDCYTSYWFRWDSSPNRELIHEIIEAFENHHLTNGGDSSADSRNKSKRGKKKEKHGRVVGAKDDDKPTVVDEVEPVSETQVPDCSASSPVNSPGRMSGAEAAEVKPRDEEKEDSVVVVPVAAAAEHKGLARKVLPDVLGLFNSNFWRLWNPNA